jgi:hypothetical protein
MAIFNQVERIMKQLIQGVSLGLVFAIVASSAQAKVFVGASHDITDFAGGSEVSTHGTFIEAVNLLNNNVGGVGVSTTINGVLFKGTQPGSFYEVEPDMTQTFANASFVYHGGSDFVGSWSSGGAYATLANSQIYNFDDGNTNYGDGFGVVNLSPGQLYELQIFMLDDRSGINKTFPLQFEMIHFQGDTDHFDDLLDGSPEEAAAQLGFISGVTLVGGSGANGEIATVTFAIDPGFNGLFVNTYSDGAFNGMQLRSVTLPDLDADNDVDGNDYLVAQRGLGTQYTAADLAAIRQLFGTVLSTPVAGSVPEPSTVTLVSLVVAVAQRSVRGRRRQRVPA